MRCQSGRGRRRYWPGPWAGEPQTQQVHRCHDRRRKLKCSSTAQHPAPRLQVFVVDPGGRLLRQRGGCVAHPGEAAARHPPSVIRAPHPQAQQQCHGKGSQAEGIVHDIVAVQLQATRGWAQGLLPAVVPAWGVRAWCRCSRPAQPCGAAGCMAPKPPCQRVAAPPLHRQHQHKAWRSACRCAEQASLCGRQSPLAGPSPEWCGSTRRLPSPPRPA